MAEELGARPPDQHDYLSHEEFASAHGADPKDIEKVQSFAHQHGLDVVDIKVPQRRIVLSGTVASFSNAFGVYLARYEHPGGSYRGRTGPVHVPEDLAPIIEGVLGLDNRPQAWPHFRLAGLQERGRESRAEGMPFFPPQGMSFFPPQVATLYNFPTDADGTGQCIAIIEFGGGYRPDDLDTYFTWLGIPTPMVSAVSVDGGNNSPGTDPSDPNNADGEVMLDVEVAGAIAPGAKIIIYFAPNTDQGFHDAIATAVHDDINKPSVISISWGGAESLWTDQARNAVEQALQDAAALGVTVCCASGDMGSSDIRPPQPDDGLLHVDFPASCPFALACGGTRFEGSAGAITNEVAWNEGMNGGAGGGGVSDAFDLPTWQANANVPPSANPGGRVGRGVPDVAGDAAQATGYRILVDGQQAVIHGTSAVAPLYAGLIALINQKLGRRVGYLNPMLYKLPADSGAFNDIVVGNNDISGNNGPYPAGPGWDACTGLGTPNGQGLVTALSIVTALSGA
jgi:kumamolisin